LLQKQKIQGDKGRMKLSKKKKVGGTGRPHKWASGKTKTIRVPVVFLKEVLAFISELDRREVDRREQQRKESLKPFIKLGHPDPWK
jgi:hypothetical protein